MPVLRLYIFIAKYVVQSADLEVLSLLALLVYYWYKGTNTDAASKSRAGGSERRSFTCFTSTKVQLLTPEAVLEVLGRLREAKLYQDLGLVDVATKIHEGIGSLALSKERERHLAEVVRQREAQVQ